MNNFEKLYRKISYDVIGLSLKIDVKNDKISDITSSEFAIITAYNPYGITQDIHENMVMNNMLEKFLTNRGYNYINCIGGLTCEYAGEPSYFIYDIFEIDAKIIGKIFKQNAIVYGNGIDCIPKLMLLV